MQTTGHPSQHPFARPRISTSNFVISKDKIFIFMIALTMTTNGQLNNTQGYHIKPTNSMCSMISGFRLKGSCSSVRG